MDTQLHHDRAHESRFDQKWRIADQLRDGRECKPSQPAPLEVAIVKLKT